MAVAETEDFSKPSATSGNVSDIAVKDGTTKREQDITNASTEKQADDEGDGGDQKDILYSKPILFFTLFIGLALTVFCIGLDNTIVGMY